MFFLLSKLFILFFSLYPAAFFLLLILGMRASRGTDRRKTRRAFLVSFLAFGLLSTDVCADRILRSLEDRYPRASTTEAPEADAIIVLGGMMDPVAQRGATPEFTDGSNRLFAGLELLKAKRAPILVLSGGSGLILQGGPSEATLLRDWIVSQEFAVADSIVAESQSRNTAENAIHSAAIARDNGWKRILLVTSAFHMHRSVAVFEKSGSWEVIPYPTDYRSSTFFAGPEALFPSAHAIQKSWIGIKEYIGILAYWIKGYI